MLILPASSKDAKTPYKFKATGISVYSFEETLYHCLHYWKQSVDDFCSEEFGAWVKGELGLSYVASKIKSIEEVESFSERLLRFLSLTDYLDYADVESLRGELVLWESRQEWMKLKERGDDLMNRDEPEKAYVLYVKALTYQENAALYNNAAIALMKQGGFGRAAEYLKKAMYMEPENVEIVLHLAECCVLYGDFKAAGKLLDIAEGIGGRSEVFFFRGEITEREGDLHGSVAYYERAIEMEPHPHYIYKLADVFVKLRQYERATKIMDIVPVKDKAYLKKLAEFHAKNNNIPAAIKTLEEALKKNRADAAAWARLAGYHLLNYDHDKAYSAVATAMAIEPHNPRVNLEYARVRKAQGRIKDYMVQLNKVLSGLRSRYRENVNYE